jgi:hypothetical protein
MEAIKVRPSFETRVVIYLGYIHNYVKQFVELFPKARYTFVKEISNKLISKTVSRYLCTYQH